MKYCENVNSIKQYEEVEPTAPLFVSSPEIGQLADNLSEFHAGDLVEITLEIRGISQATGCIPIIIGDKYESEFEKFLYLNDNTPDWILDGIKITPVYDWGYATGTRRNVSDGNESILNDDDGFFRRQFAKVFEGKLKKGEEVFYKFVGFVNGAPVVLPCDNTKTGDEKFIKQYGETTDFSYGCTPTGKKASEGQTETEQEDCPQSDLYVYRMITINEDGDIFEYPPDLMRYRCEQMGVKCVPLLWRNIIPKSIACLDNDENYSGPDKYGKYIEAVAKQYCEGPDPIGKTHIREGVVCRIVNRPKFTAFEMKNPYYRKLADD